MWNPSSIHCNTWTFPLSFTTDSYVFIGSTIWIDAVCANTIYTRTVSYVSVTCINKHCMGNYSGMIVIGY